MIDEQSRREMRTVGGTGRERAVINDCGWTGGTSSRKALLMIAGEAGRVLTLDDLREAAESGLPTTASAGNGPSLIDIAEVIGGYDTDRELPVLFVDDEDGCERLSMFLYDIPVAV